MSYLALACFLLLIHRDSNRFSKGGIGSALADLRLHQRGNGVDIVFGQQSPRPCRSADPEK